MPEFAALFWKELSQFSKRRRFVVENTIFIVILAYAFYASLMSVYHYGRQDEARRYVAMSEFGRDFFVAFAGFATPLLCLAAVSLGADALGRERVRGTLLFLLLTRLDVRTILAGKLAAVVVRVFSAFVLALPVVALASTFGGFDWELALGATLLLLGNAILYACVGLAAATSRRGGRNAVGLAIAIAFLLNWALGFLSAILSVTGILPKSAAASMTIFGPLLQLRLGGVSWTGVAATFLGLLFAARVFFLAAARSFRRNTLALVSPLSGPDKLRARPKGRRWTLLPRVSQLASHFMEPGMVLRELSVWRFSAVIAIPLFYSLTGVAMFLVSPGYFRSFLSDQGAQMAFFTVQLVVLSIALALQAARRIAAEREGRTFQLLGITALGPAGILLGKAAAVLLTQLPAILLLIASAIWLVVIDVVPWIFAFPFLGSVAASLFLAAAIGLYFSLPARKQAYATIVSFYVAPTATTMFYGPKDPGMPASFAGILLAGAALMTFLLVFVGRRRPFGMIVHAVALGLSLGLASSIPGFFWSRLARGELSAWFEPGSLILAPAAVVLPVQILLLAWIFWVQFKTFDAQVRHAA